MADSGDRRVVLVTGAASGIGKATALRFGASGASLCCFDLDADGARETAESVNADGGEAFGCGGDVSDEVDVKGVVTAALERYSRLDVLANVAGIGHFRHTPEESLADWNRIMGVNLTGTFLMSREALPHLVETKGVVVNVASIAGLTAHPYTAAYGSSKGGVVMLTKTLALEYATRGVRVNAICPGGVVTPIMTQFAAPDGIEEALFPRIAPPNGQLIDPAEIAVAIEFLASPEMANMTGAVLAVDGGVTT